MLVLLETAVERMRITESEFLKTAGWLGIRPALVLDEGRIKKTFFHESDVQLIEKYLADRITHEGSRLDPHEVRQ